jgi:hypothetical protein
MLENSLVETQYMAAGAKEKKRTLAEIITAVFLIDW